MNNSKKNKLIKEYLLFPLYLIICLPIIIHSFIYNSSQLYIAVFISFLIAVLLRVIIHCRPFLFVLIGGLPMIYLSIVYSIMSLEYGTYINETTWSSIINTNFAEANEFSSGIKLSTKILVFLQLVVYIFYLFFTYKKRIKPWGLKYRIISLVLFLILLIDFTFKGASKMAFPFRSFNSLYDYIGVKRQEAKYYDIKKNAKFNAKRDINEFKEDQKETVVVVIGETLRRDHLEYYGYSKPTTPLLKEENLILFSDVISASNQTVNSLQRAFTLVDGLEENEYWKYPSLIKPFKEVGFKTYWLSTQLVYDKFINEVSFIAQESDTLVNKLPVDFDATIIEPYKNVLKEKDEKKLIIIHLLGSHANYVLRYPSTNNTFDTNVDDWRQKLINEYDNSVRFNDFVLHSFLSNLKKEIGEKSFFMFSDHGESLFDAKDDYCYHGSVNPSKSEYDIPFVSWLSPEFKKNHAKVTNQLITNKDKSIILSDLFHTLPAFYGIDFEKLIHENNFLGKEYIEKTKRKVVNGSSNLLEYNTLKNNEKYSK